MNDDLFNQHLVETSPIGEDRGRRGGIGGGDEHVSTKFLTLALPTITSLY